MRFFKQIRRVTTENDLDFMTQADAAICLDKSTPGLFSFEDYLRFIQVRRAWWNSIKFKQAKKEIYEWQMNEHNDNRKKVLVEVRIIDHDRWKGLYPIDYDWLPNKE